MDDMSLDCSKLQCSESDKNILNGKSMLYMENKCATYSIDDVVDKVGYGKFQLRLMCLAGLGWLADSFETIILSLIGDFIACDWTLQRWQNVMLTSTVFGGMMIGSPILGAAADIYGRKRCLVISMFLLFLFGTASAVAPSFTWMVIFRCCMGFALGGLPQGVTICSEYFPTNIRGKAGFYLCYFWSFGTIGIILLAWVIMVNFDNWRILLVAASLPALLVVILMKWFPESARFFLVSNQHDRAKKVLQQMADMNGKELPQGNLVQVAECTQRGRLTDLLSKNYRRAALLFWYIWLAAAFAYYGVALITPIIIKQGTLKLESEANATLVSFYEDLQKVVPCTEFTQRNYIDLLWSSAAELPGLVVFTFLIERCNRKVLLGSSCFLSAFLIFLLLVQTEYHIIILLFLFGARAITLAVFQLILIMMSEAFPTTLRAIAMGTGSAFCRLGGLVVPYVAQVLVIEKPIVAITLLGGAILLAAGAAALLPLETRGRRMQELHSSKG